MRGDEMKFEKYMSILLIMCMLSYFMMINLSMTAAAEDISAHLTDGEVIRRDALIYDLRDLFIREKNLAEYMEKLTNLDGDDCRFIINECKKKKIDPFIVLGVIKRESNFDPKAEGAAGERGLGQLMGNTARVVAENLGYVYDADKLFDSRYNLKITITQIAYLMNLYGNDVHKALTAYNRGQQGLEEHMASKAGNDAAVSDYSAKVVQFAQQYREDAYKVTNVN